MKDKILTEEAKKILVSEYGKDAIKIDKELNELATLSVKRKITFKQRIKVIQKLGKII